MGADVNNLPPGFVLDQPAAQAPAAAPQQPQGAALLPQGFVLDAPQHNQPKALDVASTGLGGLIEGVPIVGPLVRSGLEKAAAGTRSLLFGESYQDNLDFIRGDKARTKKEMPVLDTGAQITGAVLGTAPLVAAAPAAFGAGTAPLAARMAASGATGAAMGGADALVRSGGDLGEAGQGAMWGGALGAASPAIAQGAGRATRALAERLRPGPQPPTIQALRAAGDAAYKAMDDAGVLVHRGSFGDAIDDIAAAAKNAGIDPDIHPGASAAVKRLLSEKGSDISLAKIDQLRQIVREAPNVGNKGDQRIVGLMLDKLDDYVGRIGLKDIKAGNVDEGLEQLSKGRELWSRYRKSELLDTALLKAERRAASTGSGGNLENTIRQNIRQILDSPSKSRGFTDAEKEAMEAAIRDTGAQRAFRTVGKLSPEGSGLSAWLGILGAAVNPATIAAPVAGAVGKRISQGATINKAALVDALVRNGGPLQPGPYSQLTQQNTEALVRALMGASPPVANQQRLSR
jgi:hypothetical protein